MNRGRLPPLHTAAPALARAADVRASGTQGEEEEESYQASEVHGGGMYREETEASYVSDGSTPRRPARRSAFSRTR